MKVIDLSSGLINFNNGTQFLLFPFPLTSLQAYVRRDLRVLSIDNDFCQDFLLWWWVGLINFLLIIWSKKCDTWFYELRLPFLVYFQNSLDPLLKIWNMYSTHPKSYCSWSTSRVFWKDWNIHHCTCVSKVIFQFLPVFLFHPDHFRLQWNLFKKWPSNVSMNQLTNVDHLGRLWWILSMRAWIAILSLDHQS